MANLDAPTLRRAMQELFEAGTLAKGRAYHQQRRVKQCSVHRDGPLWMISADVQGSEAVPYAVEIAIEQQDDVLAIEGDCSCPMEASCKHCAAALFFVADQPARWFAAFQSEPAGRPGNDAAPSCPSLKPEWSAWLDHVAQAAVTKPESEFHLTSDAAPEPPERLLYVLRPETGILRVELVVSRRLKTGGYGQPRTYHFSNILYGAHPAQFVRPADVRLARQIMLSQPVFQSYEARLEGEAGADVLKEILATGRCHFRGTGQKHRALTLGPARTAKPVWTLDNQGRQRPGFQINPPATEIFFQIVPPWYVDEGTGMCGPLDTGLPTAIMRAWQTAPPVTPDESFRVAEELSKRAAGLPLPLPQVVEVETTRRARPTPCLRLYAATLRRQDYYSWQRRDRADETINFAHLEFDYAGLRVKNSSVAETIEQFADGKLRRLRRDLRAETKAVERLWDAGLSEAETILHQVHPGKHAEDFVASDAGDWIDFMNVDMPALRAAGWQVEVDDSFQFRIVTPEGWYTDAAPEPDSNDWFGVELGVLVEGEKLNLLPILLELFKTDPHLLQSAELAAMSDGAVIPVPLPDGRKLLFPAARARQMLGALLELLNPDSLNAGGKLRLPKLRAAELAGETEWRWMGTSELHDLCARLKNFGGIKAVEPSPQLQATLRPYQREGLNWLQFLREYEIAGVLADDMGLGKTVQALAHLLAEKESGRMDRPSLVVAPTSLMTNWRQETERFAPGLRVLVLHGLERKQRFGSIKDHDLIVTSYPLLPRDQAVLREHEFHYVILDEAQFIKNPKTTYAQAACALKARHHLCLTGTPMENHLGELWSLFNFLMPGFLADEIRFNSIFRRPIEKGKSDDRRKLLARRVAPFILRRKKEDVVKELPPKTEIVQNVELAGAQRDLYESVRLAMHRRVKEEVDKKGMSRAHIIILDALLKLRQICCHPQLLNLPSAQNVTESAKLELLLDLLPEMIEEGRRVLLFSQFTSMLAIIEKYIKLAEIPYVQLTGETRDRATPVQRFQAGEVPLFLISLKAGGTGLNLTAADTVIHYDPWWNPAVENQATDRAHRIGQEKKVFVYKLMTIGTVEEKIAAMQLRKRELVEGLLNEERRDSVKLTADDLDVLFSPLE